MVLRARVEAPAAGPVRRGLLAPGGAIRLDDPGDRWLGGFAYEQLACGVIGPRPLICEDTTKPDDVDQPGIREYDPVYLLGADVCTTLGTVRADRLARARGNLADTESFQLEQEVWDGVATRAATPDLVNDYLAMGGAGGAEVLSDDPVPFVNALAELEQALAECLHGAQGMIHATPLTASLWWSAGLLRLEGQRVMSPSDHIVIAGAGYSGSAPGAAAGDPPVAPADLAAEGNAYGTGLVYVRLGEVAEVGDERSQVARDVNTRTILVERPAAATWSGCCAVTIPVDHTTDLYSSAVIDGGTP